MIFSGSLRTIGGPAAHYRGAGAGQPGSGRLPAGCCCCASLRPGAPPGALSSESQLWTRTVGRPGRDRDSSQAGRFRICSGGLRLIRPGRINTGRPGSHRAVQIPDPIGRTRIRSCRPGLAGSLKARLPASLKPGSQPGFKPGFKSPAASQPHAGEKFCCIAGVAEWTPSAARLGAEPRALAGLGRRCSCARVGGGGCRSSQLRSG